MTRQLRWQVAAIVAFLIVVAGISLAFWPERPDPDTAVERVGSLDELMDKLAERTASRLGEAPDFRIIVTQAGYPVGTLLRPNSTIPVHTRACRAQGLERVPTPSLYPQYEVTREVAANVGLGDVMPLLGGSAAGGRRNETLRLSFTRPGIEVLSDTDIAELTSQEGCRRVLKDRLLWLVRGYVIGKREFIMDNGRGSETGLRAGRVGSFEVVPTGTAKLSLVDAEEVPFLQIISELRPAEGGADDTAPGDVQTATVSAPRKPAAAFGAAPGLGLVYVQRDEADAPAAGRRVVEQLRLAEFRVVPEAEAIESARMPTQAQVRFFNAGDEASADRALRALQAIYPDARKTRVVLPAPRGQLEVWLPRVGPASARSDAAAPGPAPDG